MWTRCISKRRHRRFATISSGRKRSAEKGIRRSLGASGRRSGSYPWGGLPIAAVAPRQRSGRQTRAFGLDTSVRLPGSCATPSGLITLPGLAVCWSSSYTRSETSRVHSHPRVMATGPDRHGAWRFGADVTSDRK